MNVLEIGVLAIIGAATILILAVFRELAPAGGLSGRGRWMLGLAFGMGVLAFAFKMSLIVIGTLAPEDTPRWVAHVFGPSLAPPASPSADSGAAPEVVAARYVWQALPKFAPAAADNPTTAAKAALGERLFFDRNLSLDRSVACASCHDVQNGAGADGRRTALGIGQQVGTRNAPTVWNAAFQAREFWDGRAGSLEEQAAGPPVNPVEMGMANMEDVAARVREQAVYRPLFKQAFGGDGSITPTRVTQAIAAYERTLITPDAPYDRFVRGDRSALTAQQQHGMQLFESAGCVRCHSGPNFSQASVFADGAAYRTFPTYNDSELDPRWNLTRDKGLAPADSPRGVWRVPSLRNVALTAPYFHNGSVDQLEEAVRLMARHQLGIEIKPAKDATAPMVPLPGGAGAQTLPRTRLDDADISAIAAFLNALSDPRLAAARAGRR